MKLKVSLNPSSIQNAIDRLKRYRKFLDDAPAKIAHELALEGWNVAYAILSGHIYTGQTIDNLQVQATEDGCILFTESRAILFFEFGAGAKYGSGHPLDSELGMGPGTYPGEGHWNDPNGWWYPADGNESMETLVNYGRMDDDGNWWIHTYGNRPYMPFYQASEEMKRRLEEIARKVWKEAERI